jgi:hypothetical protein
LTNADADGVRVFHIVMRTHRYVVEQRASRALAVPRQHFLKLDAVFLMALVYLGCSASRFPSARSDKAISLH